MKITAILIFLASTTFAAAGSLTPGTFDPVVTPPPAVSWTGPYIGGFVGGSRTTTQSEYVTTETIQCRREDNCDVGVPKHLIGNADIEALPNKTTGNCGGMTFDCITKRGGEKPHHNPLAFATSLWLTGPLEVETGRWMEINTAEEGRVGLFAGYRYDMGSIVAGAEISMAYGTSSQSVTKTAELSLGLDAGKFLPYAFGGLALLNDNEGTVRGVGADYRINYATTIGIKYTQGDYGAAGTTQSLDLRVAYTF